MREWKKIPLLILVLTLALFMVSCGTVQSIIGSVTGNEDPSVAGNKPAGDHSGDTTPSQSEQSQPGNVSWSLNGGVLTISGNGEMKDIPGGGGNGWDPTDWPWLVDKASITSVIIEPGVTTIGSEAFKDCINLSSVTIPDSVTWIGIYAFMGCDSLTSVNVPNSVTGTLNYTFADCDNLKEATIGTGIESIENAFRGCPNLVSITILGNNTQGYGLLACSDPALRKALIQNCTIYAPAGSPVEAACELEGFNFSPLS